MFEIGNGDDRQGLDSTNLHVGMIRSSLPLKESKPIESQSCRDNTKEPGLIRSIHDLVTIHQLFTVFPNFLLVKQ